MKAALEALGLPCYHGLSIFSNIGYLDMWNEAFDRKYLHTGTPFGRSEWDQLLGLYAAAADAPAIAFAEDLVKAYPEAKVVLVERDIEEWYRSFENTFIVNSFHPLRFLAKLDRCLAPFQILGRVNVPMGDMAGRWIQHCIRAHNRDELRQRAREAYREHYALVRRVVPKARLLEFRLEDGYEPLCKFLGKEIPSQPFPAVNETASFGEKRNVAMRRALGALAANITLALLPFLIVFSVWRTLLPRPSLVRFTLG
ncbi:MAG: hypothetical protein Q9227_006760 [Pyrenula ochraceoflavens]